MSLREATVAGLMVALAAVLPVGGVSAHHRDSVGPPACACSSHITLTRPWVQFSAGELTFVPRVDVVIRSRGPASAPGWTATASYEGQATFASEDVAPPSAVSFSGQDEVASGPCGGVWRLSGHTVGSVPLKVSRNLVGEDQELDGVIRMQARIAGCGFDETQRQFRFTVKEFGNLRVNSWRSVRH